MYRKTGCNIVSNLQHEVVRYLYLYMMILFCLLRCRCCAYVVPYNDQCPHCGKTCTKFCECCNKKQCHTKTAWPRTPENKFYLWQKPKHATDQTQTSDKEWWRQQSHCWAPFTDETSNWLGLCDMYNILYRSNSTYFWNFTLWPQNNRLKEGLLYRQSLLFFTLQKPSLLLWRLDKECYWISIAQGDCSHKKWKFNHQLLWHNKWLQWLFQQLISIQKAPLSACGAEVMAFTQTTPVKM